MKTVISQDETGPAAATRFAYPKGSTLDIRFSRKGRKLAEEMSRYAAERLLPKLQGRTESNPRASKYRSVDARFQDACVYLVGGWNMTGSSAGRSSPLRVCIRCNPAATICRSGV
jgi:hypothetical protein